MGPAMMFKHFERCEFNKCCMNLCAYSTVQRMCPSCFPDSSSFSSLRSAVNSTKSFSGRRDSGAGVGGVAP